MDAQLTERLDTLEGKMDEIIKLLQPVHAHAEWVDRVRTYCHKVIPKYAGNRLEN